MTPSSKTTSSSPTRTLTLEAMATATAANSSAQRDILVHRLRTMAARRSHTPPASLPLRLKRGDADWVVVVLEAALEFDDSTFDGDDLGGEEESFQKGRFEAAPS